MTFFDLIKSLIDASKERIKTPISGAFICSFTIYNWRPIVELLFSKVAIEDRIYIIDQEYCNVWAIIVPILIALVYTIGVPMLMVKIDKFLSKTKKARIAKIYEDKEIILDGKITISGKEFELKNAESGNKEIQNHLDEIKSLKEQIESQKESIKQINETNKVTVDELNNSLKNANARKLNNLKDTDRYKFDNLRNTVIGDTLHLDLQLGNEVLNAVDTLTFEEFQVLKAIDVNSAKVTFFTKSKDNLVFLDSLAEKKILIYKTSGKNHEVSFTQMGLIITDIIQST